MQQGRFLRFRGFKDFFLFRHFFLGGVTSFSLKGGRTGEWGGGGFGGVLTLATIKQRPTTHRSSARGIRYKV